MIPSPLIGIIERILGRRRSQETVAMTDAETKRIDPEHRARINRAIQSAEEAVRVGSILRKFSEEQTGQLQQVRQKATGIMGTDLLGDREGRLPGRQSP